MPSHRFEQRLAGLRNVLEDLREAERTRAEHTIWELTESALDRIYRLEEDASKPSRDDYFTRRNADSNGLAVGGLVWVRGLSVHDGHAELRRMLWEPGKTYVMTNDGWRETTIHVLADGEWRPTRPHIAVARWPTRDTLPEPGKVERNGRDLMYDEHVGGKALMPPLDAAHAYFESLL